MKNLPKIVIDVVPHRKQRYPTVGDYYKKNGELHIRISKMNSKHEFLVLMHELLEWFLIDQKGISIKEIDEFDILYEQTKTDNSEPGNDPNAPYFDEHQFATLIEKLLAEKLGVNWTKYDENVNSL